MRPSLKNLIVNKEYSRKPQMYAGSYQEMQERTPEKYAQDTIGPFPESEHQKPYENPTEDYQELEDLYTPFNFPPYQGPIHVDVPAQAPDRLVCMARTVGTWCKGMTTVIKVMWSEAKGCCAQLLVDPFRFTSGFTFSANCHQVTVTAAEDADAGGGIMCLAKLPDGQDGTSFYLEEGTDLTANNCTGDDAQATVIDYNPQMSVNTSQTLTVLHPRADCVYQWTLSGGGSLNATQGNSVVYTAPATNPNCANNATITVAAKGRAGCRPKDGVVCDTARIAVNAYTLDHTAYQYKFCHQDFTCVWSEGGYYKETCPVVGQIRGTCTGYESAYPVEEGYWCGGGGASGYDTCWWCASVGRTDCEATAVLVGPAWPSCNPNGTRPEGIGEPWDERDEWLKSQGCCPAKLF
jgi:hypothetical protein